MLRVGQEVFVAETQNGHADGLKVRVARLVLLRLARLSVDITVEFKDQLVLVAEKVRDVVADLMLATKLEIPEAPVTQQFPHDGFRWSLLLSQFSCRVHQTREIKS